MPHLLIGLTFLLLATAATSGFTLLMRYAQEKGYSVLGVGGINYVAAAVVAAGFTSLRQVRAVPPGLWLVAGLSGVGFVLTYLLLTAALRRHGVTIPTAAVQIAMVAPVVASAVWWHERMGFDQALGVVIALAAILLLAPAAEEKVTPGERWAYLLVPGIFALSGATRVAQKALTVFAVSGEQPALAALWFGGAALFSVGMLQTIGWPRNRGEWLTGVCLGLVNLGSLVFLLRTLTLIPAVIAFPAVSCLALITTSAGGYAFWQERPTRRSTVGLLAGLLAVALLGVR